MAHPLKQLQKLLQPKSTNNGRVIATQNGGLLTIATKYGTQSVTTTAGGFTKYAVGGTVKLINGQVVGKRVNQPTTYVL